MIQIFCDGKGCTIHSPFDYPVLTHELHMSSLNSKCCYYIISPYHISERLTQHKKITLSRKPLSQPPVSSMSISNSFQHSQSPGQCFALSGFCKHAVYTTVANHLHRYMGNLQLSASTMIGLSGLHRKAYHTLSTLSVTNEALFPIFCK